MLKHVYKLVALLAVTSMLAGCGTAIPDTKGMTVVQASKAIESAGFAVGDVQYDEDAVGAVGAVVEQTPESGKRAKAGSLVVLTVAGPAPVRTPDLSGLDLEKAAAALIAGGLTLGEVTESWDASAPVGSLISQAPAAETEAPQGSPVALVISKGPEPIAVPSTKGRTESEARKLLESAGFAVKVEKESDKAKKGTVIGQKPAGGEASPGSTIKITVSSGVKLVTVPNVEKYDTGSDSDASRLAAALKRIGLRIRWVNRGWTSLPGANPMDAADEAGSFYGQSPKGGKAVPKGSVVTVTRVTYPPVE